MPNIMSSPSVDQGISSLKSESLYGHRWRVLIVDDEDVVRQTLGAYLNGLDNFEIFQASNALEGLSIVKKQGGMDGVFVDINMPGMDGIEFLGRLKAIDRTIVATIITGQPSMNVIVSAMRAGASDFLTKPFKFDQFQVAVERMIRERSILKENELLTEEVKLKKALEQINKKLESKVREQAVLFAISDTLSHIKNTNELYNSIVKLACALTGASQSYFWVVNREEGQLILMGASGPYDSAMETVSMDRLEVPCVRVAVEELPIYVTKSADNDGGGSSSNTPGLKNQVLVPFNIRNEIFGVLAVCGDNHGSYLGEEAIFLMHLLAERASLTMENLLLYDSLSMNLYATLRALVRSLEAKDPYTKLHSQRVTHIALRLGEFMGVNDEDLEVLEFAGNLHDIGKIGIRDQVLMKPGRLTRDEYEIIKAHPVIGEEIVSHLGLMTEAKGIIRHHHERWDGKGYPDGLAGDSIPALARILAVADTYDAMTTDRPYRKGHSPAKAHEEIVANSATQFDPDAVAAFSDLFKSKPAQFVPEDLEND